MSTQDTSPRPTDKWNQPCFIDRTEYLAVNFLEKIKHAVMPAAHAEHVV